MFFPVLMEIAAEYSRYMAEINVSVVHIKQVQDCISFLELCLFQLALSNDMKNMAILGYRFLYYLYCSLNRNCIYRQNVNSVNIKYPNVSCLLFSRK